MLRGWDGGAVAVRPGSLHFEKWWFPSWHHASACNNAARDKCGKHEIMPARLISIKSHPCVVSTPRPFFADMVDDRYADCHARRADAPATVDPIALLRFSRPLLAFSLSLCVLNVVCSSALPLQQCSAPLLASFLPSLLSPFLSASRPACIPVFWLPLPPFRSMPPHFVCPPFPLFPPPPRCDPLPCSCLRRPLAASL